MNGRRLIAFVALVILVAVMIPVFRIYARVFI